MPDDGDKSSFTICRRLEFQKPSVNYNWVLKSLIPSWYLSSNIESRGQVSTKLRHEGVGDSIDLNLYRFLL